MNARIVPAFGMSFAIGTGIALAFSSVLPLPLGVVLLVLCAAAPRLTNKLTFAAVMAAGLLMGLMYTNAYVNIVERPTERFEDRRRRIEVTVTDYPTAYDEQQRVEALISRSSLGTALPTRTMIYLSKDEQLEPGDRMSIHVKLYSANVSDGFDRDTYYRSIGVPILAEHTKMTEIRIDRPEHRPFWYYPKYIGKRLQENIISLFSERQADFLSALLLGKRDDMSKIDYNHLVKAGMSHITAVSGLHVGFLMTLIILLFGRRLGAVFGIPILVFFVLMVGASPSVLRAAIMYGMILIAFLLRREQDSLNFLFTALVLVLASNPASLMSVSLQLSFLSTFGIICFSGRAMNALSIRSKKLPRTLRKCWSAVAATMACSVCSLITCPVLLYHFGYISVFAPFANMLSLWAVTIAFPLGMITCIVSLLSMKAAAILAVPVSMLTRFVLFIADVFAGIKGGLLYGEDMRAIAAVCIVIAVYIFIFLSKRRRLIIASIPVLLAAMVGYSMFDGVNTRKSLRVTCLSEGSAQSVVVSRGETVALIDCGSSGERNCAEDIAEYLDWWNYDKIDMLVLTAYNKSHAGSLQDVLAIAPVNIVYGAEPATADAQAYTDILRSYIDSGDMINISGTDFCEISEKLGLTAAEIDEHLAVKIESGEQSIWLVHSLTQNRLLALLDGREANCSTLVCSDYLFADREKQENILSLLSPEQIVLETGWTDGESAGDIPVHITKTDGDITIAVHRRLSWRNRLRKKHRTALIY